MSSAAVNRKSVVALFLIAFVCGFVSSGIYGEAQASSPPFPCPTDGGSCTEECDEGQDCGSVECVFDSEPEPRYVCKYTDCECGNDYCFGEECGI